MLKDPDAVLDFAWDWEPWLTSGETITAANVSVPAGITLSSQSSTSTTATAWLSGGTVGTKYRVTCHITTNQGRQDDRTITVQVVQR